MFPLCTHVLDRARCRFSHHIDPAAARALTERRLAELGRLRQISMTKAEASTLFVMIWRGLLNNGCGH
jgi:hypothetical protein